MQSWFQSIGMGWLALSLVLAPVARAEPPESKFGCGAFLLTAALGLASGMGVYQIGMDAGRREVLEAVEARDADLVSIQLADEFLNTRSQVRALKEVLVELEGDRPEEVKEMRIGLAMKQSELLAQILVFSLDRDEEKGRSMQKLLRSTMLPRSVIEEVLEEGIFDGKAFWKLRDFTVEPGGRAGSFDLVPPSDTHLRIQTKEEKPEKDFA